jgi:mono/diheme cytochrome c family protein
VSAIRFGTHVATGAALLLAMLPAGAQQPKAFANGDATAGEALVRRDCVTCHAQRFGDAATMYTRADRKVRTPEQLLAQVRVCNVELKAGYFPDEEESVAAYLNLNYYRFAP